MMKTLPMVTPDKFHDECAVFGIYGHKEASNLTYLGLYALQHRGQEASGIVANDGEHFHAHKGMGLVADIFSQRELNRLPGSMAIGHNRYSTSGGSDLKNVQPLTVNFALGNLALAHNGNLINATVLRNELEAYGAIFQSTSDTEVVIHLIAHSRADTLSAKYSDRPPSMRKSTWKSPHSSELVPVTRRRKPDCRAQQPFKAGRSLRRWIGACAKWP